MRSRGRWKLLLTLGVVGGLLAVLGALPGAAAAAQDRRAAPAVWDWPGSAMLTVKTSPFGGGWVRSIPYQIDCPFECERPFEKGQQVILKAHPTEPGFSFESWSGKACEGQGKTCVFTITGDTTVTANFSGAYNPPSTSSGGSSGSEESGSGGSTTYDLTLIVNGDYKVTGGGSACTGPEAVCHYTLASGTSVTLHSYTGGAEITAAAATSAVTARRPVRQCAARSRWTGTSRSP